MGNFIVLDLAQALAARAQALRRPAAQSPALPTNAELGTTLLEPHPSWMTRITREWEKRYTR